MRQPVWQQGRSLSHHFTRYATNLVHLRLQESAVECLAALTQHSQEACRQLLQHTSAATQQQPTTSQQLKQAAAAAAQAQPSVPLAGPEQQQQQVLPEVVQRLLQLMREYDSRLRFQCAACICHLSRAAQQETARQVSAAHFISSSA